MFECPQCGEPIHDARLTRIGLETEAAQRLAAGDSIADVRAGLEAQGFTSAAAQRLVDDIRDLAENEGGTPAAYTVNDTRRESPLFILGCMLGMIGVFMAMLAWRMGIWVGGAGAFLTAVGVLFVLKGSRSRKPDKVATERDTKRATERATK